MEGAKLKYMKEIEMIIEKLNFEKIHEYMVANNWNWQNTDGFHVPTVQQIKDNAYYLLQKAYFDEKKNIHCGTGGFYAYKFEYGLKLSFELSNYFQSF